MDLETHTVAGAVDEPARGAAVLRALLPRAERVVSGFPDDVLDELVHLAAGDPWTQRFDADVLRAPRDLVELGDLRGRLAFRDGARHVRPVPGRLVLREDVHDDGLARMKRPRADQVRIGGLFPRRDDRALRDTTELEQPRFDDRAQPFGGERLAGQLERAVRPNGRALQSLDAFRPRVLGSALRRLERGDLVRTFRAAALAEVAVDDELDARAAKALGHPDRKVRPDGDAPHAARLEETLDDACV